MRWINKYIGDLFIKPRFYIVIVLLIVLFILAFYVPLLEYVAITFFCVFIVFCGIDYFLLFFPKKRSFARRVTNNRFSNGDKNRIGLIIENGYSFPVDVTVIDELPPQLQIRAWERKLQLMGLQQKKIYWYLQPLQRGEYNFGDIRLFISSRLGLLCKRVTSEASQMIPVYPAFTRLHKYELLSNATLKNETGSKRMRKIGQSMEFEQIKEYISGDDIRNLNWKASARKGGLMVNSFMEERSQQIYCIIDKGRLMKMPFEGMTLLDYAINSCLIVSNVCLKRQDRVGLITFSNVPGSILPADRKPVQIENILQTLYKQETDFLESDFEMLYQQIRNKIKNRSLLILFTNFESLSGLNRQIDYLRAIARYHLLLVVFFKNTELEKLAESNAGNVEDVYIKTVAAKFAFEKRLIAKELAKYGILTILSSPGNLTVNTINRYLELKTKQAI